MIDTDLTVKPAEIASPIDQYGKAVSLQNLMTTGALNRQKIAESQAQTQDYQAQVAQRQRDLDDQKTAQQELLGSNGDWNKALTNLQGKISPNNLLNLSKAHNADVQEKAKAGSEQLALENSRYAKIDDWMQGIKSLPDDQKATEYSNGLSRFAADPDLGPLINQGKQIGLISDHYDPQATDRMHTFVVGHLGTLKEAQTLQETKTSASTANKNAADTSNLEDQNPGIVAESATKQSHLPVTQAIDAATLTDKDFLTPEQRTQQTLREKEQTTSSGRLSVEQGRLALEAAKQKAELGPDTAQTWVDVLKKNPDAVKEVPPLVKSKVATLFSQQTGLPMPTAAAATSQASEIANKNALDNASFIQDAIKDPEIQKRLGTVLGRLGDVEQHLGEATFGLSPEAAKKAQELRTRMRYFVFQEGRGILGGRMPQQLMNALETSSANTHMDAPTLSGALQGAVGAALTNSDNVDKERFGGQARPRVLRGLPAGRTATDPNTQHRVGSDDDWKTKYDLATGQVIP